MRLFREIIKKSIERKILREYKNELRNCSLEEVKLIGRGRNITIVPFPYSQKDLKDKTKIVSDEESSNRGSKIDLISGKELNLNYWVAYSRSSNPKNNIDLWLRIGKLGADYLVNVHPSFGGRYIGIPVKIIPEYLR